MFKDFRDVLYIMNRNFSLTLTVPVSNVLRLQCHERKPRLHDGTVTVEVDRLVEIPPGGEPPDDRIEKDSVSTSNTTITRKGLNTCLHLNCTCTMPYLNLSWPTMYVWT